MKKILFSVVIPALNEEYFLPRLLSDLTRQTQNNFEVIIVDGNSQDNTCEAALKFNKILDIRLFRTDRRNVSYQRNLGASKASGRYLIFLDADSRVEDKLIEKLGISFKKSKNKLFIPKISTDDWRLQIRIAFQAADFIRNISYLLGKPLSVGGSIFIEKALFERTGGFDDKLYLSEDHDLLQRVFRLGEKVRVLKDTDVVFCMRRLKKDGQIRMMITYFLISFYVMMNGKVYKKIFNYEMGGQGYFMERKNRVIASIKEYDSKIRTLSSSMTPVFGPLQRMTGVLLPAVGFSRSRPYIFSIIVFFIVFFLNFAYSSAFISQNGQVNKKVIAEKLNDYKKYENNFVTNVVNPVKSKYLKNFYLNSVSNTNKYTTGFFPS